MRDLGKNQELALESLERHGQWPGGWFIENTSTTVRILESLVKRGLVVKGARERRTGGVYDSYSLAPKPDPVERPEPSARVEIGRPVPGSDVPTFKLQVDTVHGERARSRVPLTAARRLVRELSLAIQEAEETRV